MSFQVGTQKTSLAWVVGGWMICAPTFVWHVFLRDAVASNGLRRPGPPHSTSPASPSLCVELERVLADDALLRGSDAAIRVFGSVNAATTIDALQLLQGCGERNIAAGSTLGSTQWREQLTFYRVGGELLAAGSVGIPTLLEKSGDALTASGDISRELGEHDSTIRYWERSIEIYNSAMTKPDSLAKSIRSRIQRKIARAVSDIADLRAAEEGLSSTTASEGSNSQ